MKFRDIKLYMDIADRVAQQSYAVRSKVGAVFVAKSGVMTVGYNGTLPGWDNCCEYDKCGELVTKPEVLHAEENILGKLLEEGVSAKGGSLFLTLSPCMQCAKLLARAHVESVYYKTQYRNTDGLDHLRKAGIHVEQVCDN